TSTPGVYHPGDDEEDQFARWQGAPEKARHEARKEGRSQGRAEAWKKEVRAAGLDARASAEARPGATATGGPPGRAGSAALCPTHRQPRDDPPGPGCARRADGRAGPGRQAGADRTRTLRSAGQTPDRKSTRLNSSHVKIS